MPRRFQREQRARASAPMERNSLPPQPRTAWLVIGYGNELRCDDGAGPRLARTIEGWNLSGVRALACHQLTPELAALMADARAVIFADAAVKVSAGRIRLRRLRPAIDGPPQTHASSPAGLLALTGALYGRTPDAWLLALPAACLDFGEALSPPAQRALRAAAGLMREKLQGP